MADNDFSKLNPINVTEFTIPADPEDKDSVEQVFIIGKFTFLKSLMILEELGKLADKIDVAAIFSDGGFRTDLLIDKLPLLLTTMRPTILRIFSLVLLKNKEFERIADDEESLVQELQKLRPVVASLDVESATNLLRVGIERIGIQDIKKNFPTLLAALQA